MIYTIKEEVYIILYLVMFGIYILSITDVIDELIERRKSKFIKFSIFTAYILIQTYIIYIVSFNLIFEDVERKNNYNILHTFNNIKLRTKIIF